MIASDHLRLMYEYFKKYINIKKGIAGALIMGGMVFYLNSSHGWDAAFIAGMKQALYTFLIGGWLVALCERLSEKGDAFWFGVLSATLLVSVLTISAVAMVHYLRGTPEPLRSVLVTVFIAPPGFFGIAFHHRRKGRTLRHDLNQSKTQL
jgi:hypothetical protein